MNVYPPPGHWPVNKLTVSMNMYVCIYSIYCVHVELIVKIGVHALIRILIKAHNYEYTVIASLVINNIFNMQYPCSFTTFKMS